MKTLFASLTVFTVLLGTVSILPIRSANPSPAPAMPVALKPPVTPKPLNGSIARGLKWLVDHQQSNGGWGPGHVPGEEQATVGNTCIAVQALIRAGHTPEQGMYRAPLRRALDFICSEVEAADHESLYITDLRESQLQRKLGPYVDTFMASMVLAEVTDSVKEPGLRGRIEKALNKILKKMAANQQEDGSWQNGGWAPVLSQSIASKGLNRAAQRGFTVDEKTREQAEKYGRDYFDNDSGAFKADGSAGVVLYGATSSLSAMQESANTNDLKKEELRRQIAAAPTEAQKEPALRKLKSIEDNEKDLADASEAIVRQLDDPNFIAGFGTNGGEEFLSYLNIGESLLVQGGKEWREWDRKISANMMRIQEENGCWKGRHCITGGTFCTASALLVLMVDRTPMPVQAKAEIR